MAFTASFNPVGTVPRRADWKVAYIVATGDVRISGILASGQKGFELVSGLQSFHNTDIQSAVLDFEFEGFLRVPEPSTLAMSAIGLLGFAFAGWKRGKCAGSNR